MRKAESDLRVARLAAAVPNPERDAVCFHCQQSTEKYLKAVLCEGTWKSKPEIVAACREMINANSPRGIIGTLLALAARTDTTDSLKRIRCPTLILVGSEDKTTPPACSQSLHERIPNSDLHILQAAGHLSNLENSSEFNYFLLDFLKRVGVYI